MTEFLIAQTGTNKYYCFPGVFTPEKEKALRFKFFPKLTLEGLLNQIKEPLEVIPENED
jgi:hypothetical protein